jgi:Undecaprenyl-phosphate galactose phosphotransferase WbaP
MQERFSTLDTSRLMSIDSVSCHLPADEVYTPLPRPIQYSPGELFRYRFVKRALDVVAVLVASPLLLPVFLVIACVVRLTSSGPILYSHRRIRQNGAFFSMWKFRTMCVHSAEVLDAHLAADPEARAEWNRSHKLRNDPRITPVGQFLRKYSLDEFPQIWNVLRGDMSLVGPRPIVAAEIEKYRDTFGLYCRVKPGLTGLWQVSGRSTLTYEDRVSLDALYVQNWSLTRDASILLRTFPSIVQQEGAF